MTIPLTYNFRNLFVRKLSTSLTFFVVSVVVAVLCILLSFAAGIRESLKATGSASNVLVLKTGATAESTSIIDPDEVNRLVQTPGVAVDELNRPLISQELCVQTSIPRRGADPTPANVAVRGVDEIGFKVHTEVQLIEGRMFEPGQPELIVGKQARDRYQNLEIGGEVLLGRSGSRLFKVVGIFDGAGGALESELWAGRSSISDAFDRRFVSSVAIRMSDASAAPEAVRYIKGPSVRLNAKTETEYYDDLSSKTREIVMLTSILISIMGIGAAFAVANTMYASVDSRRREIAMLRTIGFPRRSIILSFIIESLIICVSACLVGVGASMFVNGSRQDFLSDMTWTVLAYELRVTPEIFVSALLLSATVGLVGGLAPALKASRIRILDALRKA